jgi:hypothetical protein
VAFGFTVIKSSKTITKEKRKKAQYDIPVKGRPLSGVSRRRANGQAACAECSVAMGAMQVPEGSFMEAIGVSS